MKTWVQQLEGSSSQDGCLLALGFGWARRSVNLRNSEAHDGMAAVFSTPTPFHEPGLIGAQCVDLLPQCDAWEFRDLSWL